MLPTSQTTRQLLDQLLDRGYVQQTAAVVDAMTRGVESGRIARAMQQFLDEAARLEAAGLPLTADNPVLRALRADLDDILRAHAALIDGAAEGIGRQGTQAGTAAARLTSLPGISDAMLATIGVGWAAPDPEAVAELIRLASSPAWIAELERFRTGVAQDVLDVALRGIVRGLNPLAIAREVVAAVRGMPIARGQTLMRTLQLTSYRRAVGLSYVANQDIVSEHVRIAALDDRCCLACIALHGTRLAVGEAVDDHHNGRCTSVARIRGLEGLTDRIRTGEDWFAGLPEDRQLALAGPGALELLQSGRATLRDFVMPYTDPVFGQMVREAPLWRVRGGQRVGG